jgi:CHASE2 domain-containing sensor protein
VDRDGIVRRYLRWMKVSACGAEVWAPTLPFAAFKLADPIAADRNAAEQSEEDLIFRFTGDRYGFDITDAAHILTGTAKCPAPEDQPCAPMAAQTPDVSGRIVLIGGDFSAAHDRYRTPMGERAGVELMAHAVESEIRGGGFSEANLLYSFLFDLAVGHALLMFYYWFRPRHPLIFGPFAGLLVSFFLSWWAFYFLAYWLSFVPVVCGVVIHELREEIKEKRKRPGAE